jgi:uncharacterized protein YdeI (YjbR/CyaY-like superfamily)
MVKVTRSENSTQPATLADWREWLALHHSQVEGVWLVLWKQASGKARLSYGELVEEALCFGWIDSKPRALNADRSMLWVAPRKPGTGWSRINKLRVDHAIAAGRMTKAGLDKVRAAQRDGSWSALDAVESLSIPSDLAQALARHEPAAACFEQFPRSVKRSILEWIASAKGPAARSRRVEETAKLAAMNKRANQWRQSAQSDGR